MEGYFCVASKETEYRSTEGTELAHRSWIVQQSNKPWDSCKGEAFIDKLSEF